MTLVLAIGRTLLLNKRSEDNIKLLLVGELLSPKMAREKYSAQPQTLIREIERHLLQNGTNLFDGDVVVIGADTKPIPTNIDELDYLKSLTILYCMSLCLKKVYQSYIRDTHIEYYISMATRGNASDEKVSKIQTALTNSAGYTPLLSSSRIISYYQHHGDALSPNTTNQYLTYWNDLISETALQLKLVMGPEACAIVKKT